MSARARTPSQEMFNPVPAPNASHINRGYGTPSGIEPANYTPTAGNVAEASPLAQSFQRPPSTFSNRFDDGLEVDDRSSTYQQSEGEGLHRTASTTSKGGTPARSNTLKKQKSLSRKTSLKKSGSRKSLRAGSIKGVSIDDRKAVDDYNSAFYTPVPTTGAPTEVLANRFQAWRKMLKDLIAYFREIQSSYESRSKSLLKVSNVINTLGAPTILTAEGGLNDASRTLRDYHKQAITEAGKAKDIENDVIAQLSGLRADLGQKIKEIKSLSGDFKNSVEKEKDHTRKAVSTLQEALSIIDSDPRALVGKEDPYIVRLNVDRQIERQVDEENYLHRAYLNLEGSGRELESIVIGEIQKAYNAFAGVLKREADEAYSAIEQLRSGPITMSKDYEWNLFVKNDPHFVDPNTPVRKIEDIEYPGKSHPAAAEVRAGMLERKSKYLKSYTPGWYVLSPTHLHEFKSADRIYTQPPVMSLLLADQKLGSRSQPGSSSHKFSIKGRQTGSMHRGHSWIFRAESYETMLAWYDDIQSLTEKTGEERNAFVRKHARSFSGNSMKAGSDSGLEEDEADEVPYSANASLAPKLVLHEPPAQRPQPGRFPSEFSNSPVDRHLQPPLSPSSGSSLADQDLTTVAGGLQPDTAMTGATSDARDVQPETGHSNAAALNQQSPSQEVNTYTERQQQVQVPNNQVTSSPRPQPDMSRHDSNYASWMAPAVGGAAAGAGAVAAADHWREKRSQAEESRVPDVAEEDISREPNALHSTIPQSTTERSTNDPSFDLTANTAPSAVSSGSPLASTLPVMTTMREDIRTGAEQQTTQAHKSGSVPPFQRQNTDISISNLHIPGEYPRPAAP